MPALALEAAPTTREDAGGAPEHRSTSLRDTMPTTDPTPPLRPARRKIGRARLGLASAALVLALAGPAAVLAQDAAADAVEVPARSDTAILVTSTGAHQFTIEIADDPVERARGLMFREEMARDHGMLFDFAREDDQAFWMKNTPLSLDMIFIAADGNVVSIAPDTAPFSTDSVPSEGPARFVLEVNAGVAADIGLAPGDRLLHRRVER